MKCPICDDNVEMKPRTTPSITFECPNCGLLQITDVANVCYNKILSSDDEHKKEKLAKLKATLFYYLRVIKRNYLNPLSEPATLVNAGLQIGDTILPFKDIFDLYPQSFDKRIDMIMQLLNTKIVDVGDSLAIPTKDQQVMPPNKYFLLSLTDHAAFEMMYLLKKLDYIDLVQPTVPVFTYVIRFTANGWRKIDSLARNFKSKNVFVAMSFDNTDPRILIAESAIRTAIEKAGYIPMIIKDLQYNQSIMPQINYEIRKSAFVIADLTKQNNGAYYEAGFAKGCNKEVIFTCHDDDFKYVHFDTKQINTIMWNKDKKAEFVDALYNRIHYTIGDYASIQDLL